ncbi:cGMP-dependent protein kinase [Aureococcus anophagefferens]|nr:cGMP-dependent protein kinase [Aureococcus anophagefferens]
MDRSPGGMKRHLAKQDSQKDVREQRFTAMANALIIPVRIKNAMVPMEKPDSRRRETRFEKVNKGLEFEDAPEARDPNPEPTGKPAMRTTIARGSGGARFLVKVDETKAAERRRTKLVRDADGSRRLVDDSAAAERGAQRGSGRPRWRRPTAESVDMKKAMLHTTEGTVPFDIAEVNAPVTMAYDARDVLPGWISRHVWPTAQRIGEARVAVRAARFHSCSRDEKIVEEGERGLTFFILVSGTAEVFKHSSPGKLATLKAGSSFAVSFGEASLGPGAPPRNATIVCSSDLAELLVLHKADYDQIMKDYQKSEHRKAFKCMKRIPLFRHWSRSRLDRLCDMLQWNYFKAGTVVVRQGDLPDNVYFILDGRCVVSKDVFVKRTNRWPSGKRSWVTKKVTETVNVRLLELDSGSYFGEKGILENTTRAATVAALVDSTIVSLDKVAFLELLQRGHATSKGANKYAGANMGYPTEDEIISVISAIQDPAAAAARANHEEVDVQAQIDNDTNRRASMATMLATGNLGARDMVQMADDLDGEGEPTEKNDGDESSECHGTLSGPPRGVGGKKERRLPPVIRRHVHRANQRGHHRGLDEHLLDVICEHNMVEYNRKLLEKERAKAKLAILNDPNYVPDRGTGHVLHQPEMHYTQQHRDTSHDDVG